MKYIPISPLCSREISHIAGSIPIQSTCLMIESMVVSFDQKNQKISQGLSVKFWLVVCIPLKNISQLGS